MRVGLVLGAGGVVGGAFHAGVLAALSEGGGWDARTAEIVVGTSAGSVTGAVLRAGLPPVDLARRAMDRPLSAEGRRIVQRADLGPGAPPLSLRPDPAPGRIPRMASPAMLARLSLRPWSARPGALAAAVLPAGRVPTDLISEGLRGLFGASWPDRDLWVCAVRLSDGQRVVFGRGAEPRPPVGTAVAASCAIPGFFAPVDVGGVDHVDGGAHSLCNLDLVAGLGLDLVVVSSPMSIAGRWRSAGRDAPLRRLARAQLGAEAARVRRRGTPVLAFQPTPEDRQAMGVNAMDPARRAAVAAEARESTLRRLERPEILARLRPDPGSG